MKLQINNYDDLFKFLERNDITDENRIEVVERFFNLRTLSFEIVGTGEKLYSKELIINKVKERIKQLEENSSYPNKILVLI